MMNEIKKITQHRNPKITQQTIIVYVSSSVKEQIVNISYIIPAFEKINRKLVSNNKLISAQEFLILKVFENAQNIVNEYLELINIMREDYLLYASLQKLIMHQLHIIISLIYSNQERLKKLSMLETSNSDIYYEKIGEIIKDITQINNSFEEISNYSKTWIENIGGMIRYLT